MKKPPVPKITRAELLDRVARVPPPDARKRAAKSAVTLQQSAPRSAASVTPRLRERKKDATRRALVRVANQRFHSKGFEATTIDEICSDAGVSRRTFFRYFANKDALAFPNRAERLEHFLDLLEGAPETESALTSMRRIAQIFAREYAANRDQLIAQQRLISSTPSLIAREHDIDHDWENAMARAFSQRLVRGQDNDLRARILAGAVIGVIRATMRHWFDMDGRVDLGKLGSQALDALQDGFLPMATVVRRA